MGHEEKIKLIANHYGYDHQVVKMYEELSELAVALTHKDKENIIEEMGDVLNVVEQLAYLLDVTKEMEAMREKKLDRTIAKFLP